MRTIRVLLCTVAAALVIGSAAGCSSTHEVGKSAQGLFRGEVEATAQQSPAQVAQAVDGAIADVKLIKINSTTKKTSETVVTARTSKDAKVIIAYRPVNATAVHVCVSTGAFGDSELRQQVWDALRVRLGLINMAAAPAPANAPASTPTASVNGN